MKIINLDRGEAYQLNPGTQLTIERTNPFFNDYGEQTVPCNIPASEHNLRLIGHPSVFGRTQKLLNSDVAISDGGYYAVCRQAILSAKTKGNISTSFYLNDGSMYTRMMNVKLKDIFDGEYVKDAQGVTITTVTQGIAFCRSLLDGSNPDYAIFPVLVNDDSGQDNGYNFKVINMWGKNATYTDHTFFRPCGNNVSEASFWGETERTEVVDGTEVTLTPGYYMSPFIRCNTVLKRIFSYFGYTLNPNNFFAQTEPFTKMVFINNVIDVLVNGKIRVNDLLPDVTANVILDVFRKKFCCEFSANESTKQVDIVFLQDMTATDAINLTGCMTEEPEVTFNTNHRRIVLSSADTVDSDAGESYDDLTSMEKDNPTAEFDPKRGLFYKQGFRGDKSVQTILGPTAQPYNTGEALDEQEIEVPDIMPERRALKYLYAGLSIYQLYAPYIGKYATLNSKMTINSAAASETDEDTDTDADAAEANALKPMLAIAYLETRRNYNSTSTDEWAMGTVNNYTYSSPTRLWDYSLLYNGDDGVFRRFWSYADLLYRNALDDVKVRLLLDDRQKMDLPSIGKITIHNTEFLFNKLKFTVGGKNQPVESELKTLHMLEPVDNTPTLQQLLPMMASAYVWVLKQSEEEVTQQEYEAAPDYQKNREFYTIYPADVPEASMVGTHFYEQVGYWINHAQSKYYKDTYWVECQLRT